MTSFLTKSSGTKASGPSACFLLLEIVIIRFDATTEVEKDELTNSCRCYKQRIATTSEKLAQISQRLTERGADEDAFHEGMSFE